MKRGWLGAAILTAMLAACLAATWGMDRIHRPVVQALTAASEAALSGELEQGRELAAEAREQWDRWAHLRGCFCDHAASEEADRAFASLGVYGRWGDRTAFAAASAELARMVQAVGEAHSPSWWNFF